MTDRCLSGISETQRTAVVGAVGADYGLTISSSPPRRLGGAINHVLRVATTGGDVIVRVHRPETTPDRLYAVHLIQEHLRSAGLPIPAIMRTRAGDSWIAFNGRLVEVLEFVPGGHEVETWEDGRAAFTALGRLHAALRTIDAPDLPAPPFGCYAPPKTALALFATTEAGFRAEAAHPDYGRATEVRTATAAVLRRLVAARTAYEGDLPRVLVHGDFVGYNVLIEGDNVIAILDFDRLAEGHRVTEIARNLMYVLSRVVYPKSGTWASGVGLSDSDLTAVAGLVATYVTASGWPLTQTEILALPFEMAGAPVYPIAMAGTDPGHAVLETLIFAQHVPLTEWLVDHAHRVSAYLHG
jgi:Ser/Thr protein kinase RdoA (MazF antagonist)